MSEVFGIGADLKFQRCERDTDVANEEIERAQQCDQAQTEARDEDVIEAHSEDLCRKQGKDGNDDKENTDRTQDNGEAENAGAPVDNLHFLDEQLFAGILLGGIQTPG